MKMNKAANEELGKMRLENSSYQSVLLKLEQQLQDAQLIEIGYVKPYNRTNLKFPYHQSLLIKQRKLRKTKSRINEINQRKIRLYNRILDITEGILMDDLSNIVKICDEITYIWQQYMETCKKYKNTR